MSIMYRIGICDDGENMCAALEKILRQYGSETELAMEIAVWYTGEELQDYLAAGNYLDILFLDIELSRMTGIDLGSYIRNDLGNLRLQIVYISGKSSYAMQLFRTQPLNFLVKPIRQEQVNAVMDTACRVLERRNEIFSFLLGNDHYYVPFGDILYFESQRRKVRIAAVGKDYEFYGALRETAKRLPADFIEIHQSFLVNRAYIRRYGYESVEMANGDVLTISRAKRKAVRERMLKEV